MQEKDNIDSEKYLHFKDKIGADSSDRYQKVCSTYKFMNEVIQKHAVFSKSVWKSGSVFCKTLIKRKERVGRSMQSPKCADGFFPDGNRLSKIRVWS